MVRRDLPVTPEGHSYGEEEAPCVIMSSGEAVPAGE